MMMSLTGDERYELTLRRGDAKTRLQRPQAPAKLIKGTAAVEH